MAALKISIITSVYNARSTIEQTILSVLGQTYENIEYIVIDGGSNDGTTGIVEKYSNKIKKFVSEKDGGIYYGLNKGLAMASGDVVGFLHADDLFYDENVVTDIVNKFVSSDAQIVYGDLLYVSAANTSRVIRHWHSSKLRRWKFIFGWMPPHPTMFIGREIYDKYGDFDVTYKIAADYDFILRVLYKYKRSAVYLPRVVTKMRLGGASNKSINALSKKSREDLFIMHRNRFFAPFVAIIGKYIIKLPQFLVCFKRKIGGGNE
ncbi:MAG: glycosyltransferase [Gammaproteobacteria bacterium]|nr:glycosyltransferase [Gammaproteobacteria bacterium]